MPDAGQRAPTTPSEGITGVAGALDDQQPPPRLPVTNEPVFTTFGGAGGDSATSAEGGEAPVLSTAAGSGGSGSVAAGSGGRLNATGGASAGGSAAGRGGAASGGSSASGGKASLGGASGVGGQTPIAGTQSAGAAAAGATSGGNAGNAGAESALGHALLFSEYVEGSGSAKALEIAALEAASLEGCELETYFNGKTEPSRLALHGQLARGEVYVLCSSELAKTLSACSRSTSLTFNGDDAVGLSCDGVLLDFIGELGVDPGDGWDMNATLDHTLRRRCEITLGRREPSSPFVVDPEWTVWGRDTFSDLGVRECSP